MFCMIAILSILQYQKKKMSIVKRKLVVLNRKDNKKRRMTSYQTEINDVAKLRSSSDEEAIKSEKRRKVFE